MKVPYICCSKKFEEHYTNQSGSGIPHYEGISFQRGYGLTDVFRCLFRAALPFLARGGKVVGKEALVTGTKVINDVLSGKDLETAAKSRSKEAGLARKAMKRVQSMIGQGKTVTGLNFTLLSKVFDGGPVEFHISGSGEEYVDLSQTQLYVKAKIVKADGTPLEKDEKIGPVNLFMHSLFSQMDISLNDHLVSNSSNTYSYRSYFETLLNHGLDCKTSQLTSEMFYKDNNDGLKLRSKFFELSAPVDMISGLHGDLFHQERLLLNLVDVKIKLILSKPEFCLQGDAGYKVVLEKINLLVRKVRVSPGVILGHAKALENDTAKYPLNRVLCKVYSVPKGSMSFVQDNIFVGQMPKRIIVGCVDNDAFHGTFEKSPFDFKHYHMNFIGIYVDGQSKPHSPLELNFDKNNYIKGYHSLFLRNRKKDTIKDFLFLEKII
ncbi:uncharacterized protein F54H12.2 [Caerostris extrusa]|uniref:Uncharacterized protein F54H12.2 n=1 Tax=Caerostris extrusa TaxID=172846 RepID=A0AAV4VS22_CAEEX|nr:uncharacterized protein F54H12.2 [Caerostris extrusa]